MKYTLTLNRELPYDKVMLKPGNVLATLEIEEVQGEKKFTPQFIGGAISNGFVDFNEPKDAQKVAAAAPKPGASHH